jgi:hypothetical protein
MRLAMAGPQRLAVYEAGNQDIRMIDLAQGAVTILARNLMARDMVYRAKDDALYFSTEDDRVRRLGLQDLKLTDVVWKDPKVPSPGPLCTMGDELVLADRTSGSVAKVGLDGPATVTAALTEVGKAKDLVALTCSQGVLYGLSKEGGLVRVNASSSVELRYQSAWGPLFRNEDHPGCLPLIGLEGNPAAMVCRPEFGRRFFISSSQCVLSVTDYDFEDRWGSIYIPDFDYPVQKPPRTFRILAVGSSRNGTSVPVPLIPSAPLLESQDGAKEGTYPKQLEFWLNSEAALRDGNVHFQVLSYTCRGQSISSHALGEILELVKKYDIDLVWGMVDYIGYEDYYLAPLTAEGVPGPRADRDYTGKKLSERATAGPAARMLERCRALKLDRAENQEAPGAGWSLVRAEDDTLQSCLEEMAGKRLALLQEKMGKIHTSGGKAPRLGLCYFPSIIFPNDRLTAIWKAACSRYQLPFVDFSGPYNALRTSYYPVGHDHWTPYGNQLVARILGEYLAENKWVPLEAAGR